MPSPLLRSTASAVVQPRVLNLQAVDICNSRCVMCNIWKDGKRETLSLDELRRYLSQPFFSEVTHVGITGGEPTLRKDLFDLYQLLPEVLPKLVGASFITHGMQTERAVEVYSKVHEHYRRANLTFEGMVSLDGIGTVHDEVRGRKGAFDTASRTLLELRRRKVPAIAACTIVRRNVYGLHDLLAWGKANDVYVRFRVAEFINRLYNDSCASEIRSFTPHELRHLVCFFHVLLTEYEKDPTIRKTYYSILSLLTGGERLIGCPYRKGRAINVDSRGGVAACAPKGTALSLPAAVDEASATLETQRAGIVAHCANCIHDYHDDWSPAALEQSTQAHARHRELYGVPDDHLTTAEVPAGPLELTRMTQLLLAGWYGTETAGDIAILQGIISEYLQVNPSLRFQVLSLHPYYTRSTIAAWPAEQQTRVRVIDYSSEEAWQATIDCDAVVMAGGPLMDIHETGKILCLFKRFADLGKPRVIEGCGVGPLNRAEYRWNVCRLARLATRISVRDSASRDMLRKFAIRKPIEVRPDPAVTFLRAQGVRHQNRGGKIIRCFLRELTGEYPQGITPEQSAGNLAMLLTRLLAWYPEHRIELWAMHHFPVGYDDRLFAQKLSRAINNPRLTVDWAPRTPREIIDAMAEADFCVCMRFHSSVFALETGVPFLAIDYSAGGKIQAALEEARQEQRLCRLADLEKMDREQFSAKVWFRPSAEKPATGSSSKARRKPVVLHLLEHVSRGGGSRAMMSLAKESLRLGGPEHRAVSLIPADATGLALAKEAGVEVLSRPSRRALNQAIAEADIVLTHWWNSPELAEFFQRELPPMRLALWMHVGGYHPPHVITPSVLEFADFSVACSPHTYTHPAFGALSPEDRKQKTSMILAGADFDRLEGLTRRKHDGFRVGYIGTTDPVKMHRDYIAMSCAVRVPEAKFVVCGYGTTRWLTDAAEKLGRSASFEFRGPVDDIRSVLEELDVYGYPLCEDTYAAAELNLQEAMFAGLPVVAFPYGGIGKLIQHGETGLLVHSPGEYAAAIELLHANPAERARLGANAAAHARQHWGSRNAAKGFNELFARLLTQPKRERRRYDCSTYPLNRDPVRDLAINPGARLFIEGLADEAKPFLASAAAASLEEKLSAERAISGMSHQMHQACAIHYRRVFATDPLLNLWAGLGCLQAGYANDAMSLFDVAHRHGMNHWRILWYRALAAEKAGKAVDARGALQRLLQVAPNFEPAREMLSRLGALPQTQERLPAEAAQHYVMQSQGFVKEGNLPNARECLARALELVPGQTLIMELLADMDCRLRNFDSASRLYEQILQREPQRQSPRLAAIRTALRPYLERQRVGQQVISAATRAARVQPQPLAPTRP